MATKQKKKNNHKHIMFRYFLTIGLLLIFSALIGRKLYHNTIRDAANWNLKADSIVVEHGVVYPERGDILAADGSVMVTSLTYFNVRMDYRTDGFDSVAFVNNIDSLSLMMAQHYPSRTQQQWRDHLMNPLSVPKAQRTRNHVIVNRISYNQLETLKKFPFFNINRANKTGLKKEVYTKRSYPYGSMARLCIGRAAQDSSSVEIHGRSGLERSLDRFLYGQNGTYRRVPFTKSIGKWDDEPKRDGYDVTTTIDINLQDMLDHELSAMLDTCGAEWATAILMEVATGEIKAISNIERGANGEIVEAYNRAVIGYEPGSVVKPITMMFALEMGKVPDINAKMRTPCAWVYGGGKPITDAHNHGDLSPAEIIEHSSNVGMAKIGALCFGGNPKGIVKCYEDIGFFEDMQTNIFEAELPAMPRDPKPIDMSRMAYGYATRIPPIYTLSVYNAIANDGKYVRPRLVKSISHDGIVDSVFPVSYIREHICSPENAAKLRSMLRRVVDGEHGTARSIRNDVVPLAGKTGTCYHYDTKARCYNKLQKRLAFCGFFPADNPKYSCMVLTFHPTKNFFGAASTSGCVFRNMALKMYARGMLDNTTPLPQAAGTPENPIFIASATGSAPDNLIASINSPSPKRIEQPRQNDNDPIPVVRNYSMREAVTQLESAGYKVAVNGVGRVKSQSYNPLTNTVTINLEYK